VDSEKVKNPIFSLDGIIFRYIYICLQVDTSSLCSANVILLQYTVQFLPSVSLLSLKYHTLQYATF
jgi:hypothetical protein